MVKYVESGGKRKDATKALSDVYWSLLNSSEFSSITDPKRGRCFHAANPLDSPLSRRDWLKLASAGALGASMSGWLETLAADTANNPQRKRSCIFFWMSGGPSQTGHVRPQARPRQRRSVQGNSNLCRQVCASANICRNSPSFGNRLAVIRSMSTKEGEHGRATSLLRTGYMPTGSIQYPPIGQPDLPRRLARPMRRCRTIVSIAPYHAFSPAAFRSGFLGPQHAPLIIGDMVKRSAGQLSPSLRAVAQGQGSSIRTPRRHLRAGGSPHGLACRRWNATSPRSIPASRRPAISPPMSAPSLMKTAAAKAFNLEEEKEALRDAYGRNLFGQGCLLARRLVERGVPFVEVTLAASAATPRLRLGHASAELRRGTQAQPSPRPRAGPRS